MRRPVASGLLECAFYTVAGVIGTAELWPPQPAMSDAAAAYAIVIGANGAGSWAVIGTSAETAAQATKYTRPEIVSPARSESETGAGRVTTATLAGEKLNHALGAGATV